MISWNIRECSHGGFVAERIGAVHPGTLAGYAPGFVMGGIVYESANFDTRKQADKYIERRKKEGRI